MDGLPLKKFLSEDQVVLVEEGFETMTRAELQTQLLAVRISNQVNLRGFQQSTRSNSFYTVCK